MVEDREQAYQGKGMSRRKQGSRTRSLTEDERIEKAGEPVVQPDDNHSDEVPTS